VVKADQYPSFLPDAVIQVNQSPEFPATGKKILGKNIDVFLKGSG